MQIFLSPNNLFSHKVTLCAMQKHCLLTFCDINISSFIIILGKNAIINKRVSNHSFPLPAMFKTYRLVWDWVIFRGGGAFINLHGGSGKFTVVVDHPLSPAICV